MEAADGKLKIWTLLNGGAVADEKPARQVCRVANESGIPEAKDAVVIDAGAELMERC